MSRLAILLLVPVLAAAQPPKADTHQIKLDGHTFTLPKGFTVERVAGPPLVDRPIVASFDDRGRLYVADSSGSNEKPAEQLKNPTHRIVRLEDTDGDGKFDKSTVFADKMMFPEGILWHRGAVYVAAPPHIWKLTDADDNGQAEKRDIWFDGKTLTGCANDLHGPYLGPDGWLYWAKGAFAKQEYTLPNGKKFTTRAAHIFRARPDGTGIEPVMTGGMDNPVDVAFLPNGERFFTTTFFQQPAAGQRDGLIHAVYGGIYGKDHDVIYDPDHKWTGPHLMPVMTHMGPAAPCGLHCYESGAFGLGYASNLFACQFNLRKVSRHVLKPHGSTYGTEDSDFLVSDNTDFHPTDVIEDADGSLLVVDTGGWYKLCCPSSQLVKADVLGAIYRVRNEEGIRYEDPWGKGVDWKNPAQVFDVFWFAYGGGAPRTTERAIEELAARGDKMIDRLRFLFKDPNAEHPQHWVHVIRIATRIDSPAARSFVRDVISNLGNTTIGEGGESVRQAAIHSMGLWRDKDAVPILRKHLKSEDLITRRMTAEALGRIRDHVAVPDLLKVLAAEEMDRTLEHALIYALIQGGISEHLKAGLASDSPRVRRAALVALDQLGEPLDSKAVLTAMKSPDPALREAAAWIVGRHPEWADDAAAVFREQLAAPRKPADREVLVGQLARLAKTPGIQMLLAATAADPKAPAAARTAALRAMARSGQRAVPADWSTALTAVLTKGEGEVLAEAIATLRSFPTGKGKGHDHTADLRKVIASDAPAAVRLGAMAAVPGGMKDLSDGQFRLLLDSLDQDRPAAERGLAADVLSRARLSPAQLNALIDRLPRVSPLDLDRVLGAFAPAKDEEVGKRLLAALNDPAVRPALRVDAVKERIKQFPPAVHKEAEKLYAVLNADYEGQRARLEELSRTLPAGDVRRGQAVFNSAKTSCIACHTVGYVGGKQGPDLTRIGGIRTERDLLESILFPSASFVQTYAPLIVTTKDGQTFNGVPKKDAPDEIVLVLAADKEVRIPREDVEEVRPGKVSIMPDGLDKQLTPQELADLIAFLKACR